MPVWSEILEEIGQADSSAHFSPFDAVRRKYLRELAVHTGRDTVLYASGWIQRPRTSPASLTIGEEDLQSFMEVTYGLKGDAIDLVVHSPGGSPEAAEAIVAYLRSRFSHIRVMVPHLAMSAATMIACAADEVVLGKHSFLGPTDPQLVLATPLGVRAVPAQAMLDQFSRALVECADPAKVPAWVQMLGQYGPDLLATCEASLRMSEELVRTWLEEYMFNGHDDGRAKAKSIAEWLADHKSFKSHSRHIPRSTLKEKGLVVADLEADDILQDLCLSVYHATTHTFADTDAYKIVESHTGRAFIKLESR